MNASGTYVATRDAKAAVQGHEESILDELGIDWRRGRPHVDCPYPSHGGKNDWRWDAKKAQAFCTCAEKGDGIIDVIAKVESLGFEAAKIRAAELIGRPDLVQKKSDKGGQRTDAAALMNPPTAMADASLPRAYLAHRLGITPADVLMPATAAVGWRALAYFDPPASQGGKPVHVGDFPACVFETVAADGRRHAHRVYASGSGKAELGKGPGGVQRDAKKSAKTVEGDTSTAGRSVLWGDPTKAEWIVAAEGIETAAGIALAFREDVAAGVMAVTAAISAGGVEAFQVYPGTKRVTVAADRDEARKPFLPEPTRRGERAAREFGMREHNRKGVEVCIALPGAPGTATDWLDILRADGVEAVRSGIEAAVRFVPTAAELNGQAQRTGREAELRRVAEMYPIPELNGRDLSYRHTKTGQIWMTKTVFKGRGDAAEEVVVPIATPFGVKAKLRMADAENDYGLRLVVQDMSGCPRSIDVDRGDLASMNGVEIRRLFLLNGVRFEDDGETVAMSVLKAANPEAEIAIVRHPGWHDVEGHKVYVAPDGTVIGLPKGHKLELSVNACLAPQVARGGTLEGWKAAAAAAISAPGCPHFTLGVVSGFAGILVALCALDSCGINLSGQTSAGKTTAQRLGASAWSVPDSTRNGLFQVAKTTVNGFEFLAMRANGTVFALDELAHLSGRDVAKAIYTLASGIGKARMTASGGMRESHRWRTFAILSAETSLEAKIKADGENWTGGQAVRVVDIDVTGINRLVDVGTLSKIDAIRQHYGYAGPAFVQALFEAGTHERAESVRAGINMLAGKLAGPGADAATIRAAIPFAILLMAGRMAQDYGLLPKGEVVKSAVNWAWAAFTKSSDAVALDPTALAIGNIRTWVAERWNTSIHWLDGEGRPTRDAVGWWNDDAVFLTPDRLVEAAGGTLKESLIGSALHGAGMLAKTKGERHLFCSWVPKVGRLKAYALSREHFGRGPEREPEESDLFKTYAGGRK